MDGAGVDDGADILVGDTDRQVVEAVGVEVTGSEFAAEVILGIASLRAQWILALFQQQVTRRQTAGTAEQYLDDAPFEFRSGGIAALAWNTDGKVVETIGVEIACGQCGAEQVAFLRSLGDGGCVLVETPQCGSEHDRNAPG